MDKPELFVRVSQRGQQGAGAGKARLVPGPLHRVDVFHCLFVVHRYCLFMILNALRCALGILSGNIIFKFATPENLRIFRRSFFTGGVAAGNSISRTDPFS